MPYFYHFLTFTDETIHCQFLDVQKFRKKTPFLHVFSFIQWPCCFCGDQREPKIWILLTLSRNIWYFINKLQSPIQLLTKRTILIEILKYQKRIVENLIVKDCRCEIRAISRVYEYMLNEKPACIRGVL